MPSCVLYEYDGTYYIWQHTPMEFLFVFVSLLMYFLPHISKVGYIYTGP